MTEMMKSWASVAIVLVTATWYCWPYLKDPVYTQRSADASLPRIAQSLPAAKDSVTLARDPFAPPATQPKTPEIVQSAEPLVETQTADAPSLQHAAVDDLPNFLEGLVLNGTLIQGDLRIAIINHRLYEAGSRVVESGPVTEDLILKHVEREKVLVSCQGRILELKYQDRAIQNNLSTLNVGYERNHE